MLDSTLLYPGFRKTLPRITSPAVKMGSHQQPGADEQADPRAPRNRPAFRAIYGGNSFEQKKPHPIGIETLMSEYAIPRERTMMVGDSAVDIRTARNPR